MQILDLLLAHYDDSLREQVVSEKDHLWSIVAAMDQALEDLFKRSAAVKDPKFLIIEMRRLRVRGLHFFAFLHTSRRALRVASSRLRTKAKLEGLDGELNILGIELNLAEMDDIMRTTDALLRKSPKPFTQMSELRLLGRTILLPLASNVRERSFGSVGRIYSKEMREMISTSMKNVYKAQAITVIIVVWRIVQPTILPLIAGFLAMYLIHAVLESRNIHFLDVTWSVLGILVVAYVFEKIVERWFEHWHLERYRKDCRRTAIGLFLAEVRARVAMIGLIALSKAQPKI